MNYIVRAVRIFSVNDRTQIEDYRKEVSTYTEAEKDELRLKSTGEYSNIYIEKINKKIYS